MYPQLKDRIERIFFGDQYKPEILRKVIQERHYAIIASEWVINPIPIYYYYYRFHQSNVRQALNLGGFPCRKTLETVLNSKIKN